MRLEDILTSYPCAYTYKVKTLFNIFDFEFQLIYKDKPIYYLWSSIKAHIKRLIKGLKKPTLIELTTNLYMGDYYFKEPQKYFQDGKRKLFFGKRAINEYAKKNNLMYGGDDLDQEAAHNKKNNEEERVDQVIESAWEQVERKRILSNNHGN